MFRRNSKKLRISALIVFISVAFVFTALSQSVIIPKGCEKLPSTFDCSVSPIDSIKTPFLSKSFNHPSIKNYPFELTNLDSLHDLGYRGQGNLIIVVDGGHDTRLTDIKSPLFIINTSGSKEVCTHGDAVLSEMAALHNNIGISGYAPDSEYGIVQGLSGDCFGNSDRIAIGIKAAVDEGLKLGFERILFNMSFGAPHQSESIKEAIQYGKDRGCIFIAAIGNDGNIESDGKDKGNYPACDINVISVASSNPDNTPANYSSESKHLDLSAHGTLIYCAYVNEAGETVLEALNGTSMAAPHTTGSMSCLWSAFAHYSGEQIVRLYKQNLYRLHNLYRPKKTGAGSFVVTPKLFQSQSDFPKKNESSSILFYVLVGVALILVTIVGVKKIREEDTFKRGENVKVKAMGKLYDGVIKKYKYFDSYSVDVVLMDGNTHTLEVPKEDILKFDKEIEDGSKNV